MASQDSLYSTAPSQQLPAVTCLKCGLINNKKKPIQCSQCQRWAHLTCVGITRAQDRSLNVWNCTDCLSDRSPSHTRNSPVSPPSAATADGLETRLAKLKGTTPVILRIPKPVRGILAQKLSAKIEAVLVNSTEANWWELLAFLYTYMRMPSVQSG